MYRPDPADAAKLADQPNPPDLYLLKNYSLLLHSLTRT